MRSITNDRIEIEIPVSHLPFACCWFGLVMMLLLLACWLLLLVADGGWMVTTSVLCLGHRRAHVRGAPLGRIVYKTSEGVSEY